MNRIARVAVPLLLLMAGCFSSVDNDDYKPFTSSRWREMLKEDQDRLKPEEQRSSTALQNPLRVMMRLIGEGISKIHDLATGHSPYVEAAKLLDPSPDLRRRGIVYLSDYRFGRQDPYAKQYLEMAWNDPDYTVRAMAIRALNRARDKRAVPAFLLALEEKNDAVRLEGAKALANNPAPSAIAPLIRRLENLEENVDVRVACADALRLHRTSEVAQALVRALRDRNFAVAWQARKSLQLMTGQDYRYDNIAWLNFLSGATKPFG